MPWRDLFRAKLLTSLSLDHGSNLGVRCDYLAYYDVDHSNPEQRATFLEKVKRTFEAW
jgi:hypothetical protein